MATDQRFDEVVGVLGKWGEHMDEETRDQMLMAALHELSHFAPLYTGVCIFKQRNGDTPLTTYFEAVSLQELARYDEAKEAFQRLLELERDAANVNCYAHLLAIRGEKKVARKHYQEALGMLDSDGPDQLSRKAYSLLGLERFDEALAAATEATEQDPSHWLAHQNRGRALLALDRPSEALEALEEAARVNPNSSSVAFYRAHALARTKKKGVAKVLKTAIDKSPHLRRQAEADPLLREFV